MTLLWWWTHIVPHALIPDINFDVDEEKHKNAVFTHLPEYTQIIGVTGTFDRFRDSLFFETIVNLIDESPWTVIVVGVSSFERVASKKYSCLIYPWETRCANFLYYILTALNNKSEFDKKATAETKSQLQTDFLWNGKKVSVAFHVLNDAAGPLGYLPQVDILVSTKEAQKMEIDAIRQENNLPEIKRCENVILAKANASFAERNSIAEFVTKNQKNLIDKEECVKSDVEEYMFGEQQFSEEEQDLGPKQRLMEYLGVMKHLTVQDSMTEKQLLQQMWEAVGIVLGTGDLGECPIESTKELTSKDFSFRQIFTKQRTV